MKRIKASVMALAMAMVIMLGAASGSRAGDAADENKDVQAGDLALLRRSGQVFTSVAREAIPAVVFIRVEKTVEAQTRMAPQRYYNDPFDFFGDELLRRFFQTDPRYAPQPRRFKQVGQGSGFLVSKDGYILTNNHVVGDADKIIVKTSDGKEYQAKRIGSDPKTEVAVIKIDGNDFPHLEPGDSADLQIGEWVMAVGNPFGLSETVTVGVVSAKGRSNIGIADYEDFIQTDAAINPGNSGGPLLNIEGKVVGINTAIYSRTGGSLGIGFAIPIDMAIRIMEQLKSSGKVVRGYLGVYIQEVTGDLADSFGMKEAGGILVSDVVADTPADDAGLEPGDIILEIDGRQPGSVGEFRNFISSIPPGTTVEFTVFRQGKTLEIKARTDELTEDEMADAGSEEDVLDRLGISIADPTADQAARLGHPADSGVVITQIERGSVAANAGLRPGLLINGINRKAVRSVKEAKEALAASAESGTVLLRVKDGRYSRFVVLGLE